MAEYEVINTGCRAVKMTNIVLALVIVSVSSMLYLFFSQPLVTQPLPTPKVSQQLVTPPLPTPMEYTNSGNRSTSLTPEGELTTVSTSICEGGGLTHEAFETCKGRTLGAGYVLNLLNGEQLTAGATNLISLQCWASTINMVVVEYFMETSLYRVPDAVLSDSATTPPNFVRLNQLYDIDHWNKYSKDRCYAPLVNWEDFLCNAPRETILVYLVYPAANMLDIIKTCPPTGKDINDFNTKYSYFFKVHGFRIVREVCVPSEKRRLTVQAFNSMVLGNYSASKVSVVINLWRGIQLGESMKVQMTGTKCNRNGYFALQYAKPSTKMLADVLAYQEQWLDNKDYIAVMVRFEFGVRTSLKGRPLSPNKCLEGVISLWKEMKLANNLSQTFWSLDIGMKYGTLGLTIVPELMSFGKQALQLLKGNHNISYAEVEQRLTDVSGIANEGYIASLQQNIAVRAKCLLLIGGGTFHGRSGSLYTGLHPGSQCRVTKNAVWLMEQCRK